LLKIDFHPIPGNADFEGFFTGHQCDQLSRILQELVQVMIAGDRVEVEEADGSLFLRPPTPNFDYL